jgi:exosortase A
MNNIKILIGSLPLLVIAYFPEWKNYFQLWLDSYIYRHGFLVLAGTVFLLYQRRHRIHQLTASLSRVGLIALIVLSVALLIAHAGNIKLIRMLLLPLLIVAWGTTIWGKPFFKTAGPPIVLILFATPFWDELSPILQWITVAVDERVLAALSIPATIEEFYITIPSGVFHVAHGCSGIRYLIVGLYLGAFYSVLTETRTKQTMLLILAGGFLALLTNWIRVAWIIAAGHYSNMESSLVYDHEVFGWVVFIVVTLLPFFVFTHYLDKRRPPKSTDIRHDSADSQRQAQGSLPVFLIASLPLIAIPLILAGQSYLSASQAERWKSGLPTVQTDTWKGPLKYAEFWNPKFVASDIHQSGVYVSNDLSKIQADFFGYKEQAQGKELVYYQNRVFDKDLWTITSRTVADIPDENPWGAEKVNQLLLESVDRQERATVWYWYEVGGVLTTSSTKVQLLAGLGKFSGDTRSGIWILSTKCSTANSTKCMPPSTQPLKSLLMELQVD